MFPLNIPTAMPMALICKLLSYDIPLSTTNPHPFRFCVGSDGKDVAVQAESAESEEDHDHEAGEEDHDHSHREDAAQTGAAGDKSEESDNQHCHFHAGVE